MKCWNCSCPVATRDRSCVHCGVNVRSQRRRRVAMAVFLVLAAVVVTVASTS